jgi:hypothetical protein
MDEQTQRRRGFIAVAAATCVSLACGTNYAYSAWAPQFAEKLLLTATQSNLVVGRPLDPTVANNAGNFCKHWHVRHGNTLWIHGG